MATGFVDRYKGKIAVPVGGTYIGGIQVNTSGPDANTAVGWGTFPASTISTAAVQLGSSRAAGPEKFAPASGGSPIFRLPTPFAGANKMLYYSTENGSTQILITTSTAGAVTLAGVGSTGSTAVIGTGGSTLSNTMKSTISCQIVLLGVSSVQWLFESVAPSTTGHLAFSTST